MNVMKERGSEQNVCVKSKEVNQPDTQGASYLSETWDQVRWLAVPERLQ